MGKIFSTIGVADVEILSSKRLGREPVRDRKRPILLTVKQRSDRDNVLQKAKILKEKNQVYRTIYVKKDIHPAVRKEGKRLYDAERTEKERPDNQGAVIRFDTKERKLYRNDIVIDSWKPHHF